MKNIRIRRFEYALAAILIGGVAAAALFTPARAMVERATSADASQHAAASPLDSVTQSSSGVIAIKVLPSLDGPPPPAARFYGSVKGAAGVTSITAVASNHATCGTGTISSSSYSLDITGSDSACTAAGASMQFQANGKTLTTRGNARIPDVSAAVRTDLSAP